MFDKKGARTVVTVCWLTALIALILAYTFGMKPVRDAAFGKIDSLEQNIAARDWAQARSDQDALEKLWKKNKAAVQLNNLSPSVSRFEQELAQIKTLVRNQDQSALSYLGILRNTFDSITSLFPTPEG